MRMRKKKHGAERIAACADLFIQNGAEIAEKPVEIEIGCGKGAFIAALAQQNPDVTYVAIEKISDVILLAAEKIKSSHIPNVRFLNSDAAKLGELFSPGSVRRIYLNFSDPWPKSG